MLAQTKVSTGQRRLVKLQGPPPEMRFCFPRRSARSRTATRRPRLPASMAHISPAAPPPRIRASNVWTKGFANLPALDVIEQSHKAKIHVQLLMAVKQSEPGVVRREINFYILISADHHNIFHHPGSLLTGHAGQFKTVTVKMDGMDIITRVPFTAGSACLSPTEAQVARALPGRQHP